MNQTTPQTKKILLYILIAFSFSIAVRFIWIYQFSDYQPFYFNSQFMINTNDGYFFAEGARDILSGHHQPNDISPIDNATAQLTALIAKLLPFSFESIIFYMPMVLSSLVVIPIVLISKRLQNLELGLIAAMLASIAWSYYNRTMVGYYDTDMLNIVLPMFLLWSLIWAHDTRENKYLLITGALILGYKWWYTASYALDFSFFGLMLAYTLIYDRKNLYNYKLLTMMLLGMMMVDYSLSIVLLLIAFYIFRESKFDKYVYYVLGAAGLAFLLTGGVDPIWLRLKGYVFKDTFSSEAGGLGLHFFTVMQTVREAGHIPFETFANRISGNIVTFIISVGGYAYLAYRHKIMLLALPLVGLGFLAVVGGLRFTVYAVPIMAFGIAFLILELANFLPNKIAKYTGIVLMSAAVLFPNIKHVQDYMVPTVFNADEVKILDNLGKIAGREDYVVTWWDYGYPIKYYSDVKTLSDGGRHSGEVNFPVSYILTQPQEVAAKMARLDVEYTEKDYENNRSGSTIEQMTKDYGFDDTNDFLLSLQTDIKLPKKTRDIYLYLPFRMANIYPTVTLFSNLNLMDGTKGKTPFFYVSKNFRDSGDIINLGNGVKIDKKKQVLEIGSNKVPIRRFVKTYYSQQGELKYDANFISFNGALNVIYMSNYHTFLIVDEPTYNSLYIQLMVLEEYDKSLFEKVIAQPHAKVYKLKI